MRSGAGGAGSDGGRGARLCRRLGLEALYLGYWIKNCRKMNYKTQYRPIELFVNQRWTLLT